jgi:glycosyltransferase involved in cell wall biosynthesis
MSDKKLRVCMVVACANDVSGSSMRDDARMSPVLHPAIHNLLDGLKDRQDIEVEVIYGRQSPVSGEDRWEGSLHYVPVKYRPWPVPGMGGPYLARTMALLRHIRKTKPDLVHGQGTERESGLVSALSGQPSVLTLHGNFREISRKIKASFLSYYSLAAMVEKFCIPRVSVVHCISKHTAKTVVDTAQQTAVIPNAVHAEFFGAKRQPTKFPTVVCVAGITEWKNQLLLIQASEILQRYFPECRVIFVGECKKEADYGKKFLEEIEKRDWCQWRPPCDRDELIKILGAATCVVLPSIEENFGLALAEAMAIGIPTLGADAGGIPDVLDDGKAGILFAPTSAEDLGQKLVGLHTDAQLAQDLSAAGHSIAAQRFSIEKIAAAHVALYRDFRSQSSQ